MNEIQAEYEAARTRRNDAISAKKRARETLAAAKSAAAIADAEWTKMAKRRRTYMLTLVKNGWTRKAVASEMALSLAQVQQVVPVWLDDWCDECGHTWLDHVTDPNEIKSGPLVARACLRLQQQD